MLWVLAGVLFIAWIVGMTRDRMGGFTNVLLGLALLAAATELALLWRRRYYERQDALEAQFESVEQDQDEAGDSAA